MRTVRACGRTLGRADRPWAASGTAGTAAVVCLCSLGRGLYERTG